MCIRDRVDVDQLALIAQQREEVAETLSTVLVEYDGGTLTAQDVMPVFYSNYSYMSQIYSSMGYEVDTETVNSIPVSYTHLDVYKRQVRNRTTGVLYVLDEPSIGLQPSNIVGLTGVMHDLIADGNSVVLVDHDAQILSESDWIIEMGPGGGSDGGRGIAQGTVCLLYTSRWV